ncbi:hypothetical protein [Aestuariimicrobium sp. T2.26MG-19.2B]|uniref:hypothetical protein n=1 Tax=Aestuariimicrobium sp. T2.26MG-19.2B TaxID=3040679 RepID=UPI0024778EA7|nr:hypothetical protein [Aestuariimicrobium sp. T2.26MG-19.2B]CAI9408405.1 hypothetical protein AESSP_02024 [Aestuariimicrobium sp. T2.26MG-19.2B]
MKREQFDELVLGHRERAVASAAQLLGLPTADGRVVAAADRALADVWSRRWMWWADPVVLLRRALVRHTHPGRKPEPGVRWPPNAVEWRARAAAARTEHVDPAGVPRRAVIVGGVGVATAAGATTLGLAVHDAVRSTRTTIDGGTRLRLTIDILGHGNRRQAKVYTSDPRWSPSLPALIGSFVVDAAHGTSVVLPTAGLSDDATLQTLLLHQPGLVFADLVNTAVVPFAASAEEPFAAGLFSLDAYGPSTLVWGDEAGGVFGDAWIVHGPFPGDPGRICYLSHDHLVVRHLTRGLSQMRLSSHPVTVRPAWGRTDAPGVTVYGLGLVDGTGLVAVTADEPGELSWDLPSLATSRAVSGTGRFWHVPALPQATRPGDPFEVRLTLRTARDEVQYVMSF